MHDPMALARGREGTRNEPSASNQIWTPRTEQCGRPPAMTPTIRMSSSDGIGFGGNSRCSASDGVVASGDPTGRPARSRPRPAAKSRAGTNNRTCCAATTPKQDITGTIRSETGFETRRTESCPPGSTGPVTARNRFDSRERRRRCRRHRNRHETRGRCTHPPGQVPMRVRRRRRTPGSAGQSEGNDDDHTATGDEDFDPDREGSVKPGLGQFAVVVGVTPRMWWSPPAGTADGCRMQT